MRGPRGDTTRFASFFLLLGLTLAGCNGGGRDPVLGTGTVTNAGTPPTVMAVTPLNGAIGVAMSATLVTATLSEAVRPITGSGSFALTCAAPCTSPAGTVTLNGTSTIATFTPPAALVPLTLYTATIIGAAS